MKVLCQRVSSDIIKQNRNFYKNRVKRAFVAWCAYEHLFDDVLTNEEIERAKRGNLPKDLNVHHIVPLSASNDIFVNDFSNLTVIHKKTHEFINKQVFSPMLRELYNSPVGSEMIIDVPEFDRVDAEGIKKERFYQNVILNKQRGFER